MDCSLVALLLPSPLCSLVFHAHVRVLFAPLRVFFHIVEGSIVAVGHVPFDRLVGTADNFVLRDGLQQQDYHDVVFLVHVFALRTPLYNLSGNVLGLPRYYDGTFCIVLGIADTVVEGPPLVGYQLLSLFHLRGVLALVLSVVARTPSYIGFGIVVGHHDERFDIVLGTSHIAA